MEIGVKRFQFLDIQFKMFHGRTLMDVMGTTKTKI